VINLLHLFPPVRIVLSFFFLLGCVLGFFFFFPCEGHTVSPAHNVKDSFPLAPFPDEPFHFSPLSPEGPEEQARSLPFFLLEYLEFRATYFSSLAALPLFFWYQVVFFFFLSAGLRPGRRFFFPFFGVFPTKACARTKRSLSFFLFFLQFLSFFHFLRKGLSFFFRTVRFGGPFSFLPPGR